LIDNLHQPISALRGDLVVERGTPSAGTTA
jgi:hypothetical protein